MTRIHLSWTTVGNIAAVVQAISNTHALSTIEGAPFFVSRFYPLPSSGQGESCRQPVAVATAPLSTGRKAACAASSKKKLSQAREAGGGYC